MKKKVISIILTLALCMSLAVTAFAAEANFVSSIVVELPGTPGLYATFTDVDELYYVYTEPDYIVGSDEDADVALAIDYKTYCFFINSSGSVSFSQEFLLAAPALSPDGTVPGAIRLKANEKFAFDPVVSFVYHEFGEGGYSFYDYRLKSELGFDDYVALPLSGIAVSAPTLTPPNLESASGWARPEITSAYNKGFVPVDILNNYQNIITRAEFCRMAMKFIEYKTGKSIDSILNERGLSRDPNAFSDTDDPDLLAAAALGITLGVSVGVFAPNGEITRQQAATFLMRVNGLLGMDINDPPTAGYTDAYNIADWAENGVNFCYAAGIMQGSGGQFFPLNTYTRQESIATFDRIG